ncbi:TAXI family TRAP transporter solute-binding subunit [Ottowia sp.]|uniref:TAXI family TRAP transporter solute-binding subunit n=1 Tax=Ottowia sp. TaxID=1898956 RepID=UPI003A88A545
MSTKPSQKFSLHRSLHHTLRLWVLSVRDMLASASPLLLLGVGLLVAAYWWLDPQPPRSVTLATGPAGSADAEFGKRYAAALAKDGITVQLLTTQGSATNLAALREGQAGVAFVRGGTLTEATSDNSADDDAGITSLGALFYEPLWVFYRTGALAKMVPTAADVAPAASIQGSAETWVPSPSVADALARAARAAAAADAPDSADAADPGHAPDATDTPAASGVALPPAPAPIPAPSTLPPVTIMTATVLDTPDPTTTAIPLTRFTQLRGLRVNVNQPGSGVPDLMRRLLHANGMAADSITLSQLAPEAAATALQAGEIDALVLLTAPESPVVQRLLHSPSIALMDVTQAEAYTRVFPFMQTVSLAQGVIDLATDQPPQDVTLLAPTTALLTREDTHPALRQLFAQTAQKLHSGAGWFNRARDFPNTRTSELPVSPEGDRAINGSPPFWQRYLPFWASNLLDRMWLVLGGLLVLLLPLSRIVPPLYTYRVRRRVFRWYGRLRDIEVRMQAGNANPAELRLGLDELEHLAQQIAVPAAYADEVYRLRRNIEAVRQRLG